MVCDLLATGAAEALAGAGGVAPPAPPNHIRGGGAEELRGGAGSWARSYPALASSEVRAWQQDGEGAVRKSEVTIVARGQWGHGTHMRAGSDLVETSAGRTLGADTGSRQRVSDIGELLATTVHTELRVERATSRRVGVRSRARAGGEGLASERTPAEVIVLLASLSRAASRAFSRASASARCCASATSCSTSSSSVTNCDLARITRNAQYTPQTDMQSATAISGVNTRRSCGASAGPSASPPAPAAVDTGAARPASAPCTPPPARSPRAPT
ncbi:hypothetical protein T492DRAFT_839270 [Pavlovales sp. CCMP2436]|nr:hypothetical protein T492DRAFT_839270 [Pavlovales sp. CCMP2436]